MICPSPHCWRIWTPLCHWTSMKTLTPRRWSRLSPRYKKKAVFDLKAICYALSNRHRCAGPALLFAPVIDLLILRCGSFTLLWLLSWTHITVYSMLCQLSPLPLLCCYSDSMHMYSFLVATTTFMTWSRFTNVTSTWPSVRRFIPMSHPETRRARMSKFLSPG